MLEQY